eukprot:scaffold973_cov399-Prasinococcus_capsulatus_cf.AAC.23
MPDPWPSINARSGSMTEGSVSRKEGADPAEARGKRVQRSAPNKDVAWSAPTGSPCASALARLSALWEPLLAVGSSAKCWPGVCSRVCRVASTTSGLPIHLVVPTSGE